MVGSIDPRCEILRGTHWPVKVAGVFGTRVAETILASGRPTASTGRTYGCKRSDQTLKKLLWPGGRPHMGPGARPGRRRSVIAIQVSKCRDTPTPSRDTLRPSFANSFALKRKR